MVRSLIGYLPVYLQGYEEIKAIMNTEQSAVAGTWDSVEEVFRNQYVSDAMLSGVKRLESILGITPKDTYTLEERKFNILIALNEQLPYSEPIVRQQLAGFCGNNGFTFEVNSGAYLIRVRLYLENKTKYESVEAYLKRVVPANIVIDIGLMYNTNEVLGRFTHAQLAKFTHSELREEVISGKDRI